MAKTPEGKIKNEICEALELLPDVTFWVQDSTGVFDPVKKRFRKNRSRWHLNGISDIVVLLDVKGVVVPVFLEVKTKVGRQNENQINFESIVKRRGACYFVVRSPLDAIKALEDVRVIIGEKIDLSRRAG